MTSLIFNNFLFARQLHIFLKYATLSIIYLNVIIFFIWNLLEAKNVRFIFPGRFCSESQSLVFCGLKSVVQIKSLVFKFKV